MIQKLGIILLKIIHRIFFPFIMRKKAYQDFFHYLYAISLEGMNYNNDKSFEFNGELETIKYIHSKLIRKDIVNIFDVGANEGQYSKIILKVFNNPKVNLFAFEPEEKSYVLLKRNLPVNNVRVFNIGFGDENKTVPLYSYKRSGEVCKGLSSLYKRNLFHRNIELNDHNEIKLLRIDDFCANNNIEEIDFLKLDIEGSEFNALLGANEMITKKKINFIQFEFGGTDIDSKIFFRDFYNFFADHYHLHRIVKDGVFPIIHYNDGLELFSLINYLAERK